jgi:hypothetical protein
VSNALADGTNVFRLADVMGTSVRMIERHYGRWLDGGDAGELAHLLDAGDAKRERDNEARAEDG